MKGGYLEGQGDFISRFMFIMGVTRVTTWIIGAITYLPSPPDHPINPPQVRFLILIPYPLTPEL